MRTVIHFLFVVSIGLILLSAHDLYAATGAVEVVSPARPDAMAYPVTFRSVQAGTEADNPALFLNSDGTPYLGRVGIDTWIGGRTRLYDLPVLFALSPELQAQIDVPFTSRSVDSYSAGSSTETGLADIVLSLKYRVEMDNLFECYSVLSAKFPTGNPEKGLGTGGYDFSFTHKTIVMLGSYRTVFMAGITIPPPSGTKLNGSSVEYGPTVSYMVATERTFSSTGLRFGIKTAGLHSFNSKINSETQQNALTTLDLIPEVSWPFSKEGRLQAGIVIPMITLYDLPGSANRRDLLFNIGVYKSF
ncbi:MAG: hypothetical protein J0665_18435 [Deltaproteobacteria bacterium]|nr:hypothetical protein [Deltaproteobacteria bacterium]